MQLDRIEGKPDDKVAWGSDIAAQMLRRLGVPYISLNPGASYRGLHDSLVNHLGNERPGILLCLHEDHSVAIAHGYAKATGEPMACVLHSNVGLLHGMMSLFNAWCDRVPMIVLGATGPVDAEKRRQHRDAHGADRAGLYLPRCRLPGAAPRQGTGVAGDLALRAAGAVAAGKGCGRSRRGAAGACRTSRDHVRARFSQRSALAIAHPPRRAARRLRGD